MVRMVRSLADRTFQLWKRQFTAMLSQKTMSRSSLAGTKPTSYGVKTAVKTNLGCLSGRITTRRAGGITFGLPACLLYFLTGFRRICSQFREKMQKVLEMHWVRAIITPLFPEYAQSNKPVFVTFTNRKEKNFRQLSGIPNNSGKFRWIFRRKIFDVTQVQRNLQQIRNVT